MLKKVAKINKLKNKGLKLVTFKVENDNYFDLKKLLKKIYELGIHTLLVECGRALTYKMILRNLFNEFYLFKSNKVMSSKDKINVLDIKKKLNKNFRNKNFINTYLDKDTLIKYY